MDQRNHSIDVFKLIAAFCVILIHSQFKGISPDISTGLRMIYRWPVPFFFMISGYFAAQLFQDRNWGKVLIRILRLVAIFMVWNLIYAIPVLIQQGLPVLLHRLTLIETWFSGVQYHLWFLTALIIGYVVIAGIYYYRMEKWLPLIAMGILLFSLSSEAYNFFNLKIDVLTIRFFTSISFMALGIFFRKRGAYAVWLSVLLIVVGVGIEAAEIKMFYSLTQESIISDYLSIGKIILISGITSLSISNWKIFNIAWLGSWGKVYSLGIYLIHLLIKPTLQNLFTLLIPGILQIDWFTWIFPFILFFTSLGILMGINKLIPKLFSLLNGNVITK